MEPSQDITSLERRYLTDIGKYPLLSAEEEQSLSRAALAGSAEARKKLILGNLKLVVTIARSFSSYGVPMLDLIEEGNLGLIKAVGRFDPDRGFRFSTYASWWIRQAVVRAISNHSRTIRIPIHVFQLMTRYVALEQSAVSEGLSREERAERLKISLKRYRMLEELVEHIRALDLASSLDAYQQLARSAAGSDGASSDPEQLILRQIESEGIEELMERLSDRERLILRIRYGLQDGEPHTLAETGFLMQVSRERVRQLEMRALRKLRLLLEPGKESGPQRKETT